MKLTREFLLNALPSAQFVRGETVLSRDDDVAVSIDSRSLLPGEFFVALKGPRFDGHDFVSDALAKGACGALVQADSDCLTKISDEFKKRALFIVVSDTTQAFIDLAKAWRARLHCPVLAITGSVGKTSTKEMVKTILHTAGIKAYVSFKNYNNIFGVCYNMLRVPEDVLVAVFEVGINEKGEMLQLADIVRPTVALITCIGHAHLEGLGNSLQAVSFEKRQLFAFFTPRDVGIVWGDQALLSDVYYQHPIAKFGIKTKNQVQARKVAVAADETGNLVTQFTLKWYGQRATITLKGNHQGFVNNALAASTAAYFLKVPFQAVVDGLHAYCGTEQRFEIKKIKQGRGILFNDCYNANPESMKAALVAFAQFPVQGKKIAVLGDMLELGTRENYWHRQMGRVISKVEGLQHLILVGERARWIGKTAPMNLSLEFAQNWQEAQQLLERHLQDDQIMVLVKASHGMRLDEMVKAVIEE